MHTPTNFASHRFATLAFIVLFAILGMLGITSLNGCESAVTEPSSDSTSPAQAKANDHAIIQGHLTPETGNVAQAQIFILQAEKDGTLQDITAGDFQTDEHGNFEALANITDPSLPTSVLIVEARTKPSAQNSENPEATERMASALLSQELKPGESATTAPLNNETTLEADIYVQAHKLQQWTEHCNTAQLRLIITPQIAAAVHDDINSNYDNQVKALAQTTTTAMNAFATTLLNDPAFKDKTSPEGEPEIEPGSRKEGIRKAFSTEDLENARKDLRQAFERYDNRLNDLPNNSDSAINRARLALANAQVQTYVDNNINIHTVARANQAFSEAALAPMPTLTPKTQAATTAAIENQRANFVTRSIQTDSNTVGVSNENLIAIEQAGQDLRNDLSELAELSGDISSEVHNLWQQYRQNIETRLQTSFTPQQKQVFTQMQSNIVPATRILFNTFENLPADTNTGTENIADTIANAVLVFHKDTTVLAYSDLWKDANLNFHEATAILEVLLSFATIR